MNIRLWFYLFVTQLLILGGVVAAILVALLGVKTIAIADLMRISWWDLPLYAVVLAVVVAVSILYATYTMLALSNPYEHIRAKLTWLLLEKYHHPIFFAKKIAHSWYDNSQNVVSDIEHLRQKMVQLSTDLQEFSAMPTFIGTETKEEIIEHERQRIARELHDSVSQQLFAATMLLSTISVTAEANVPETISKQLGVLERVISNAQTEMRALLLHLRPLALEDKSLKQGITHILQELKSKVALDISWELSETTLESGNEDHLFRIVQESISNTLRHAKATTYEVYLRQTESSVQLKMIDNGKGFDTTQPAKFGSYGLTNMKERIASMGGTLKVLSSPGQGTVIDISIPIRHQGGTLHD
ncbi:MAG: sensor histidine kinase [Aerococcaceae bacterium]|nr:sensor histidine kinase [Aerococcaceae bacterium]